MALTDTLLEPLIIKHLTIRNRVMSTAHAAGYMVDGRPGERYRLYQAEKAKGGLGLTICGGASSVSLDSPANVFNVMALHDDGVLDSLGALTDAIHAHGAATFCQIAHMGRRTHWDTENWFPVISPSHEREPMHRAFNKEMEDWDIRRVIHDFGQAVRRCKEGGFDGVELSNAHLLIVDQFWSPSTNRRTDGYGGSLSNRMRFGLEVFDEIRHVVGEDFVVGMRMSGDELLDGGLEQEDCLEIARTYTEPGRADFVSVIGGQARSLPENANMIPNLSYPSAPFLHFASAVKAEIPVPVFHAQRIPDLATAARAVAEGHTDMVAMTRAHIADPHIMLKLAAGREADIRPCVGAGYCVDRIFVGRDAACAHNAATGREARMPHVVRRGAGRLKVAVVGAGPGGLEAARVAAERGHTVVLLEAAERVGGQIEVAAKAAWKEALSGISGWLESQVLKAGVEIRLGMEATAEGVLAVAPDVVVVATGGRPNKGRFAGAELALDTWALLRGDDAPGRTVLLHDDHGDARGPSCAEFLAARGADVELVTPERTIGVDAGTTNIPTHLRELYRLGVVMSPCLRLVGVHPEGNRLVAVLRNEYSGEEEERVVDQVVAEHGTLPRDELYFALRPHATNLGELDLAAMVAGRPQAVVNNPGGVFRLFRVGDAVSSRNIHAAIYDSLRLCKDL
jgi:2,4-dienoyl-CoA reductase-like NADH-dependent reductase (Old Yellow Enzyme family)